MAVVSWEGHRGPRPLLDAILGERGLTHPCRSSSYSPTCLAVSDCCPARLQESSETASETCMGWLPIWSRLTPPPRGVLQLELKLPDVIVVDYHLKPSVTCHATSSFPGSQPRYLGLVLPSKPTHATQHIVTQAVHLD